MLQNGNPCLHKRILVWILIKDGTSIKEIVSDAFWHSPIVVELVVKGVKSDFGSSLFNVTTACEVSCLLQTKTGAVRKANYSQNSSYVLREKKC